jgi:hypothetical protein
MADVLKCNQLLTTDGERCGKPAAFLYTWPGKDEDGVCADHAGQLRAVAAAIGLHLQLKPAGEGGDV